MTDSEFWKIRFIFSDGLGAPLETNFVNTALLSGPMLTPGEMVIMHRLGNIAVLLNSELAERFTQENGFNGW